MGQPYATFNIIFALTEHNGFSIFTWYPKTQSVQQTNKQDCQEEKWFSMTDNIH